MQKFRPWLLLTLLFMMLFSLSLTASAEQEDDFYYEVNDGSVTITGYEGSEKELVIPETIGKLEVTAIGSKAFSGDARITSVVIPDTVTQIGSYAFSNCTSLGAVTLPDGLLSIEYAAFENSKVKEIIIPDTLTFIGAYAFKDCTSLKTLVIGSGLTSWGTDWGTGEAFRNCTMLTSLTIKEGVTCIGNSAFKGCTLLMEVSIPESVTEIYDEAFSGCELLDTAVVNGDIDSNAFYNCTSLKKLTLGNVTYIGSSAFTNNTSLTEVVFPDTLQIIESSSFENCSKIKELIIPDSVWRIGAYAFQNCSQLEKLVIGSGITEWSTDWGTNAAFKNCTKLSDLTISDGISYVGNYAFEGCTALKEITIPGSAETVGQYAFYKCLSLTDVTLEEGVETVCEGAFKDCSGLTHVYMNDGLAHIEAYAFLNDYELQKAELPETLVTIGRSAFEYTALKEVHIGDSVTTLGAYCFGNMPDLRTVYVGESVDNWENDWGTNAAFRYDYALTEVTLAEGISYIGSYAFQDCTSLRSIEIPITSTKVNDYAFSGCSSLMSLTMQRGEIGEGAFRNCYALYKLDLNRITAIGNYAFQYCKGIYEFEICDTVTYIGYAAFEGCSMNSITIPDSVTEIGAYAFTGCNSLVTVNIANNVTTWGTDWGDGKQFAGCENLRYVYLDDGANCIPSRIFADDPALEAVYLPESLVNIGDDLFKSSNPACTIYGKGSKAEIITVDSNLTYTEDEFEIPELTTYTISLSAGDHGFVSPEGEIERIENTHLYVTAVPAVGYLTSSYVIDGDSEEYFSYEFTYIDEDHSAEIIFTEDPEYEGDLEDESGSDDSEKEDPNWIRFTEEDDDYAMAYKYLSNILSKTEGLSEDDELTWGAFETLLSMADLDVELNFDDADEIVSRANLAYYLYAAALDHDFNVGALTSVLSEYEDYFDIMEELGLMERTETEGDAEEDEEASSEAEDEESEEAAEETADEEVDETVMMILKAFAWASENGLDYGTDGTAFDAYGNALCGQAIRILTSFIADSLF